MRIVFIIIVVLFLVACDGGRGTGGIQMGEKGATFDTASAAKAKAEQTITSSLSDEFGVTWRIATKISVEPEWNAADEHWVWKQVGAAITLAGSGDRPDEKEIHRAVRDYLTHHQRPGSPEPTVTVHIEQQGIVSTTPAPLTSTPAAGWHYTIKAGDTLAQLSSAFYGTPEHWRRILDANPGLHLEQLPVGAIILIPSAP